MEDQVPFKVYTFWRESDKPEVRRFGMEKGVITSYHYLNAKLLDVYPGLKGKTFTITWKDEDGDDVVVSSDDELMTMLQALIGDVIKLFIYCKGNEVKDNDCDIVFTAVAGHPNEPAGTPAVHFGVMCDSCDGSIIGFRYKCSVCDDFDLCSRCEAAGHHPEHCMVRVPTPTMPRTVIKAAIKRSRHFLKSVATALGDDCPYKKHRGERGGERKHRGPPGYQVQHRTESGPHGPHGEHYRRRQRDSWLDTFSAYMNEFANLAGDIGLTGEDGKTRAPETKVPPPSQNPETKAQTSSETQEKAQAGAESTQAPKPEASTSAHAETQCPFNPKTINVIDIRNFLEDFIRGNYMPQPPQPQAPTPTVNADASTLASNKDVEMGQGDKKSPDANDFAINADTSSSSSVNDLVRDASPDKADDWTVINNEKDLMDTASALPVAAAPIGFNLPEEFQERVKIAAGGLYPPLNPSTAVLNLKEPQVLKPVQATAPSATAPAAPSATAPAAPSATAPAAPPASKPSAAPKPQEKPAAAQPQPQPRQRHPQAHIDASIQQMLMMGFTNEGGWLTQLLESKDGNIAAVLDLLTPVNPKK